MIESDPRARPGDRRRRERQDRDHGRARGLAGGEPTRPERRSTRADLHAQGGWRARGADRCRGLRGSTSTRVAGLPAAPARSWPESGELEGHVAPHPRCFPNGCVESSFAARARSHVAGSRCSCAGRCEHHRRRTLLLRPRVSTYNAFADGIVREHAARIGRDTEASAAQSVRVVADGAPGRDLVARREACPSAKTGSGRWSMPFSDWRGRCSTTAPTSVLSPRSERVPRTPCGRSPTPPLRRPATSRSSHTAMARASHPHRPRRGLHACEGRAECPRFRGPGRGALEIVTVAPEVSGELREQYRAVLLDEYQDTSALETLLLAAIFADTAVMAVGDPHQSIYGWRGASADNLAAFPRVFSSAAECGRFALDGQLAQRHADSGCRERPDRWGRAECGRRTSAGTSTRRRHGQGAAHLRLHHRGGSGRRRPVVRARPLRAHAVPRRIPVPFCSGPSDT